jgi:hypothetical protein
LSSLDPIFSTYINSSFGGSLEVRGDVAKLDRAVVVLWSIIRDILQVSSYDAASAVKNRRDLRRLLRMGT